MEAVKESEQNRPKGLRYFIRQSVMNVEEDRVHEFKGHRNIAIEEIPPWCIDANDKHRKTRNCISRNICGFLNSGLGGTVYLGVLDNGNIEGILLSRYQRHHLMLSLKDTLERFRPPVPRHLVSIDFIPCIDKCDVCYKQVAKPNYCDSRQSSPDESIMETCNEKGMAAPHEFGIVSSTSGCDECADMGSPEKGMNAVGWDWTMEMIDQTELPKEIKFKNDLLQFRPHGLRTYKQCWCDDDAVTRVTHGHKSPAYVVEIVVRPPSSKDPEIRKHLPSSSEILLQPIFQAEDGSIYIRRHASLARRSFQDMVNEAVEDVQRVYLPILKEVNIHLGTLEALVEKIELLMNDESAAEENSDGSILEKIKEYIAKH